MPGSDALDPVFLSVHEATAHLPNRKQRLMAAYYVRLLQTGNPVRLKASVPANLYPALRYFLAEADWDHREVIWRAAARTLDRMQVEWLALKVSSVARHYSFAWLAAYDAERVICADLVLVGPTGFTRSAADYLAAQLDVLRVASDALLRRAPLAIGDALAEDAGVRAWLDERGITYSARIRPSSRLVGSVVVGSRAVRLRDFVAGLRPEARRAQDTLWLIRPVTLHLPNDQHRDESLVCYWRGGSEVAGLALTNERDAVRLDRTYNPARAAALRPSMPWRRTALRGPRAWEHHLALVAVLQAHQVRQSLAEAAGT